MKHILLRTLAIALIPLVVDGCGSSPSSDRPLTRAELIAKADPICRTVVHTVRYFQLTPAKIVRFASRLADVEERAYTQLSKLEPPPSLADEWRFIVNGFRASARDFRHLGQVADPKETAQFETLYADVRQKAWIAREDGFKDCGHY